jgi:hypothetical protein
MKKATLFRAAFRQLWPGQLLEFNLVRCDVIVNYVMNKINENSV